MRGMPRRLHLQFEATDMRRLRGERTPHHRSVHASLCARRRLGCRGIRGILPAQACEALVCQDRRGPIPAVAHGNDEPREAQDIIRYLSDRLLHSLHPRRSVPSRVCELFGGSRRRHVRHVRHDLHRLLQAGHTNLPRLHLNLFIYTHDPRGLHMACVRHARASAAGARISRAHPNEGATRLLHADAHLPGTTDREPGSVQGPVLCDARQWRAVPSC
mmetsp:Transcript_48627/g.136840  ORF Transcript_48627/g.136840 Transcript_48627/m.136840 type:complete len:217 (-) Transcript_48627:756-1406(-)